MRGMLLWVEGRKVSDVRTLKCKVVVGGITRNENNMRNLYIFLFSNYNYWIYSHLSSPYSPVRFSKIRYLLSNFKKVPHSHPRFLMQFLLFPKSVRSHFNKIMGSH